MKKDISTIGYHSVSDGPLKKAGEVIGNLLDNKGREKIGEVRKNMQSIMMDHCSIFRDREGLEKGLEGIRSLRIRTNDIGIMDKGKNFNYEVMEAIELGNQLDLAEIILISALYRKESRGAHFRDDFPERDDRNYLKHTLVLHKGPEVRYKPVAITRFKPEVRIY